MKYLMSEHLLAEDLEKFMREHEDCEFVNEYPLEGFVREAGMDVIKKAFEFKISITPGILFDFIAKSIIADIDAIVCYPDDEKGYRRFGKRVITVENSEE